MISIDGIKLQILQSFNTSNTLDSDRDFSLSRFTNTNSKDSGLGRTDDSIVVS